MHTSIDFAIAAALDRARQLGMDTDDVALLAGAVKGTDDLYVRSVHNVATSFVAELKLIALARPHLRRLERLADMIRQNGGDCETDFSREIGLRLYTSEQSLPLVTAAAELYGLRVDISGGDTAWCMRLFDPLSDMRRIDVFVRR